MTRAVFPAVIALASALAQTPPVLTSLEWRSIGPAATGGRIADLAVARVAGKPDEVYVATATGGVFKSSNAGVSFAPIFDHAGGTMSIGAVAVAPSNASVVWVGTGESDNRQSSSWGDGVYKSVDGGANWQKMGLAETRHIGRIVIHPADPDTVYIAAMGHLWGSNPERGVYKTTDGGQTWNRVLYKDEHTGAVDLAMDPRHPEVVFAAMYQRQRKGWGFNGGGPGSGIFRTTDGGATWTELRNGLPRGDKGRIGLAISPSDSRIVYAIVEADPPASGRGGRGGAPPQSGVGGVFRSLDGGDTWERMSGTNPRPSYYSRIYVDPANPSHVYIMGSNRGLFISDDAGRTFRDVFSNVHGEDHAFWIDPADSNHLIAGGDGGVSISYDRGLTWLFRLNLPIGQFYNISANNAEPFLVCGGLQDNGSWCTPSATNVSYGISFKDAFNVGGGDGMHAVFDGDDHTLLVSSQNGFAGRLDLRNMERQTIAPVLPAERLRPGQPAWRWYWTAPLIVSRFNPAVIYTAANVVFRSEDRGVSWKPISPDLTAHIDRDRLEMMGSPVPAQALSRHDGQTNFSALTAIAESPLDRNVLYTGADDGTIHITRDGGRHWTDLTARVRGLPPMTNISGITPSKYAAGRVYLTADGHFNDDYHPYVFVSEDYGQNWRAIAAGLPETSAHRLREHPVNPDVLVAGLEEGAYASFDRGAHWNSLNTNLPPVPVYDLVFQERSRALALGAHGRGIWILDDEPLGQLTSEVLNGSGALLPVLPAHPEPLYNGQFWFGAGEYFAPNPPYGAVLNYYLPKAAANVTIAIADAAGKPLRTMRGPGEPGLNRACWDLRLDPPAPHNGALPPASCHPGGSGPTVAPGVYVASIAAPGLPPLTGKVTVEPDPHFQISSADRSRRQAAIMSAYSLQQDLVPARDALQALGVQISAIRQFVPPATADQLVAALAQPQNELNRALNAAAAVQNAMDAYSGVPTEAQIRQLDWAWEDAAAAVSALNRFIHDRMPSVYKAAAGRLPSPEVKPIKPPGRNSSASPSH
ncbi:MAG TPA: hypothetical protein VGF59_20700 [Bryobacteraceae bacterium]